MLEFSKRIASEGFSFDIGNPNAVDPYIALTHCDKATVVH
jgi:hypothetical protein